MQTECIASSTADGIAGHKLKTVDPLNLRLFKHCGVIKEKGRRIEDLTSTISQLS